MTSRPLLGLLAAAALAACAKATPTVTPAQSAASASPRCLSIVGWNDLHGQLGPDDPLVDTGRVPAGGVVALADQVAQIRATGDAVVVLDAGDMFTGPIASTLAEGAPVIDAYRALGVDAVALGNHDFDFGPTGSERITAPQGTSDEAGAAGPRGALLARMASSPFPYLSANVRMKGGKPPRWPGYLPWTRIQRGVWDVGVVGYTTRDTPRTTLKANVVDLDFETDAAAAVASAVRALRKAGAFPVVLLAHASIDGPLPEALEDASPHEGELASLVRALGHDAPDIIFGGHRHAWALGRLDGVPMVTSDQHGVGLARARYCNAGKAGSAPPRFEGVERRVALSSSPPRTELGEKVAAAVAPWEQRVAAIAAAPVTTLAAACAPRGPNGSALADQVARTIVERVADAAAPPAGVPVVGLINGGMLRAPLEPGPVRFSDVFRVIPFENTVAACGTTRAGLLRVLENALRRDAAREQIPFGLAGARLRLRRAPGGAPAIVDVELAGAPGGGSEDKVWLATSDFLLAGGDGLLEGVECSPAVASQTRIREAWKDVLQRERACAGASQSISVE